MDTKHIQIADYNYPLPDSRIAKYPLPQRDHSKLLIYKHGQISEDHFYNLPSHLPQGALMVYNNTRVIQARLHFRKPTGALIEVFLMEPAHPTDYEQIFQTRGQCAWLCMIGNLKKWKEGPLTQTITLKKETSENPEPKELSEKSDTPAEPKEPSETVALTATLRRDIPPTAGGTNYWVDFTWDNPNTSFAELLEAIGELPIPPYLNRDTEESDKQTYQTVYSKIKGSVAAPTAGLHFTDPVLQAIDQQGITRDEVTLHVGAGTFKPVKTAEIADHNMHSEYIVVHHHTLDNLLAHNCQAIAVGTTSVRTLESLYYIGAELIKQELSEKPETSKKLETSEPSNSSELSELSDKSKPAETSELSKPTELSELSEKSDPSDLPQVPQWAPYDLPHNDQGLLLTTDGQPITPEQAITALRDHLDREHLEALHSATQIIIAPGYQYKIVRQLITNFHQPQSTLLLLVSAFLGPGHWRSVYDYALNHDFRFLSYGDSSLLIP